MKNAVDSVVDAMRIRLLASDRDEDARALAAHEVRLFAEKFGEIAPTDEEGIVSAALAELTGFGALQPLLDDPTIEEIWINAPNRVFIARAGVAEQLSLELSDHQVRHLVERMLSSTGRRVDAASPFVDASLPDGSRLHVVIPDITSRHWSVNIRKFSRSLTSVAALIARGSLTEPMANYLRDRLAQGANILVSGATHAGKTTLLNALLAEVGSHERIVTVEETFELNIVGRDVVGMQCRQANLEGTGEVTLRRLIKEALRMRPDRLVVGEVREAESLDLLIALNSGMPGACTIHGNSARDALTKLCTLPLLAGRNIDASFVVPTVASCIDVVVHCERSSDGHRRVAEILEVTGEVESGRVVARPAEVMSA